MAPDEHVAGLDDCPGFTGRRVELDIEQSGAPTWCGGVAAAGGAADAT
jgi:hypothetical protein